MLSDEQLAALRLRIESASRLIRDSLNAHLKEVPGDIATLLAEVDELRGKLAAHQIRTRCSVSFAHPPHDFCDGNLGAKFGTAQARECLHGNCLVDFNEESAKDLSAQEVRERWPRFFGECPDCGQKIIKYASAAHYVFGDW